MDMFMKGFLLNYFYIIENIVMPQYIVSQIKGNMKKREPHVMVRYFVQMTRVINGLQSKWTLS